MIVYEVSLKTYDSYLPTEKNDYKEFELSIEGKDALVIDDEYFIVLKKGYDGNVAPSTERFGKQWGRCYVKTYEEAKAYGIDMLKEEKTHMEYYIEWAKFRIGQCDKLINQLSNE